VIAVDTNILVYAHRQGLDQHKSAVAWLRHLAESPTPWAVPVFVLGEFVRVVTHPRVFDPPSTLDEALGALGGVLGSPSLRILNPGNRYPELLDGCLREGDARGNLVLDAQIAAVCREHGVDRLLSEDRDFHRFPGLEVVSLVEGPR
jgi:toxin-antitoxin system PIN domain toxin